MLFWRLSFAGFWGAFFARFLCVLFSGFILQAFFANFIAGLFSGFYSGPFSGFFRAFLADFFGIFTDFFFRAFLAFMADIFCRLFCGLFCRYRFFFFQAFLRAFFFGLFCHHNFFVLFCFLSLELPPLLWGKKGTPHSLINIQLLTHRLVLPNQLSYSFILLVTSSTPSPPHLLNSKIPSSFNLFLFLTSQQSNSVHSLSLLHSLILSLAHTPTHSLTRSIRFRYFISVIYFPRS